MATQLARQLAELQAEPKQVKGRPSLLFHAREAEDYDLATIHSIGVSGLAELAAVDDRFSQFQADLFSEASMETDREQQDMAANQQLNERISLFMLVLSPHILSKAASKALEFLIRHYKIHVFNIDAVMDAILPYHEASLFGRFAPLLQLSSASRVQGPGSASVGLWGFLAGCQKSGSPLPRPILVGQCVKDPALVKYIANLADKSANIAATGAIDASRAIAFYAVVLTDAITQYASMQEVTVAMYIGIIVKGVKLAQAPDYQTASYLIAARLLSRVSFTSLAFDALVNSICGHLNVAQLKNVIVCLTALLNGQAALNPQASYKLPEKAVRVLLKHDNLSALLTEVAGSYDITRLLRHLPSCAISAPIMAVPADSPPQAAAPALSFSGVVIPAVSSKSTQSSKRIPFMDKGVPQFQHCATVTGFVRELCASAKSVTSWVARVTLATEAVVSALGTASPVSRLDTLAGGRKPGAGGPADNAEVDSLLSPAFLLLEALVALPTAITTAAAERPETFFTQGDEARDEWSDDDLPSTIEYARRLLLNAVDSLTRRLAAASGGSLPQSHPLLDVFDIDLVVHCVYATDSTQTRAAALSLLGSMAGILPVQVLARLLPVLFTVGTITFSREDSYSLSIIYRLIEAVIPALRAHGPSVGVTEYSIIKVFASCVYLVPPHRRKPLYYALVSNLSCFPDTDGRLDKQHTASQGPVGKSPHYVAPLVCCLLLEQVLHTTPKHPDHDSGNAEAATIVNPSVVQTERSPSLFEVSPETMFDLCSSVCHRYPPAQQIHALNTMLLVTRRLLQPPNEDAVATATGDLPDDVTADAADPYPDIALLLPALTCTYPCESFISGHAANSSIPAWSQQSPISPAQRYTLAKTLLNFVSAHLGSKAFLSTSSSFEERDTSKLKQAEPTPPRLSVMQSQYLLFAEKLFDLITFANGCVPPATTTTSKASRSDASSRARAAFTAYWSGLSSQLYSLLGQLAALLAPAALVTIISELLHHDEPAIRRRSLAFFNDLLRNTYGTSEERTVANFTTEEQLLYIELVQDLRDIIVGFSERMEEPAAVNIQTALDTVSIVAGYFCSSQPAAFADVLQAVTDLVGSISVTADVPEPILPVISSAVLCLAVLSQHVGMQFVPHINRVIPSLLGMLRYIAAQHALSPALHVLALSALSSMRLIVGSLPQFFSPFLPAIFEVMFSVQFCRPITKLPRLSRYDRRLGVDPRAGLPPYDCEADEAASVPAHVFQVATASDVDAGFQPVPLDELLPKGSHPSPSYLIADTAAAFVNVLIARIGARLSLEPLLQLYGHVLRCGPSCLMPWLQAIRLLVSSLSSKDLAAWIPRLLGVFLQVFDFRWIQAPSTAVSLALRGQPSATTSVALQQSATFASAVEAESVTCFVSLLLKMTDSQVRTALFRLIAWSAVSDADIKIEYESSPAAPAHSKEHYLFACMCRRLVFYRTVEAATVVIQSVFLPFYAHILAHAAAELRHSTQAAAEVIDGADIPVAHQNALVSNDHTSKRKREAPHAEGRRRVRFADSDDSSESPEDEEAGTSTERGKATILPAKSSSLTIVSPPLAYRELWNLDYVWNHIPSIHDEETGAAHMIIPSAPHGLRCLVLGCIMTALRCDSQQDTGTFTASNGRDWLDLILQPVTAQFTLSPIAVSVSETPAQKSKMKSSERGKGSAGHCSDASRIRPGIPGGAGGYRTFVASYLVPLVGYFISAIRKDTAWKSVNLAVLMLTRDDHAAVRLASLQACKEIFVKGAEEALVLLPETLPYLAELLHDGDVQVQAAAQAFLKYLEDKAGEDLQHYL